VTGPRVAILSSGLGRINRGNETWALRLADDLTTAGVDVTVFTGGPVVSPARACVLRNIPREAPLLRNVLSWDRRYLLEQVTFAAAFRRAWRGEFDVVHTADPNVAQQLLRHAQTQRYRLIYKDGLAIGADWCAKFPWVQVLAPYYKEEGTRAGRDVSRWRVIPHYAPPARPTEARTAFRRDSLGIPSEPCTVVLSVGDFTPGSRKRLDWVIEETAKVERPLFLVLAGHAAKADLEQLSRLANARLPGRHKLLPNVPREHMAAVYGAADVLVHAALREPFGIVLIEAMSYGLTPVVHSFEVTRWIVGEAGLAIDMTRPGELAAALGRLRETPEARAAARARVQEQFSPEKVLPLYVAMYREAAG
jgi:glycosyltransferase involved in cell wall biosynthesis